MYMQTYAYTYIYIYTHTCIYRCTYMYIHAFLQIPHGLFLYIYTHIYIYIIMYVYICICTYSIFPQVPGFGCCKSCRIYIINMPMTWMGQEYPSQLMYHSLQHCVASLAFTVPRMAAVCVSLCTVHGFIRHRDGWLSHCRAWLVPARLLTGNQKSYAIILDPRVDHNVAKVCAFKL